jgi:hypothetical protein
MQPSNETRVRTKVRLSEIERILRKERYIVPPPSRTMLLGLIEDGTFETAGDSPTSLGWLVYEDSFRRWLRSLDGE